MNPLMKELKLFAQKVHTNAVSKGFWGQVGREDNRKKIPEKLMLIVSEISEAMEADRKGLQDQHLPQFDGIAVELADAIIRILDLAEGCNIRVIEAMIDKAEFNSTRPYMHGGNKY